MKYGMYIKFWGMIDINVSFIFLFLKVVIIKENVYFKVKFFIKFNINIIGVLKKVNFNINIGIIRSMFFLIILNNKFL